MEAQTRWLPGRHRERQRSDPGPHESLNRLARNDDGTKPAYRSIILFQRVFHSGRLALMTSQSSVIALFM